MVEPLLHDIGVHVLTDINVTLHDHLSGETWLEQHSRAPETYGANCGDVSFKELVNLFSSTARRFASQRLWNKTSTPGTQGIMLFRLGARKSWAGTNFPLHGDTKVRKQFYVLFKTHPRKSEESDENKLRRRIINSIACGRGTRIKAQNVRVSAFQRHDFVPSKRKVRESLPVRDNTLYITRTHGNITLPDLISNIWVSCFPVRSPTY